MTIRSILGFVVLASLTLIACQEEPVGAPCTPESDDGTFKKEQLGVTDLVETRNVQCETRTCITRTDNKGADDVVKYSFCSCKCKNAKGSNADKEDDLCECPPNTLCETVSFPIEAPEKVRGFYCIPKCIAEGCKEAETKYQDKHGESVPHECTASSNSDEPWAWKCKPQKTN